MRINLAWMVLLAISANTCGQGPARLVTPAPRQVVQREKFDPRHAHTHQPGGPVLGSALVPIVADFPGLANVKFEARVVAGKDAFGKGIDWQSLNGSLVDGKLTAELRVPTGGWYRLELRARRGEDIVATAGMEPFGVGEVFLVAGQSYAANHNDDKLRVEDAQGRVVAYDVDKNIWSVAHDPQPGATGMAGSIWPPVGDQLVPLVRAPVAFVNVVVGGTSCTQWLPGTPYYRRLSAAGKTIGRFRAVLWQQGESDVINKMPVDKYVANMKTIREGLAADWKTQPVWLLAKSTLHPTVYNDPVQEGKIRAAIDQLWSLPGFRPGPDTDILDGDNRGGPKTQRHFSAVGQRRAAGMWFATLWHEINRIDLQRGEPTP